METVSTIAGLLLFAALIAVIVGLINPKWVSLKKDNFLTRKQIGIYGFITVVVLLVIGVSTAPTPVKNAESTAPTEESKAPTEESKAPIAQASVESKEPVAPQVKEDANLGFTPEEFRQKFNAKLKDIDINSLRPLAEFSIKEGSVRNTFTESITPAISLIGAVSKQGGKVESLSLIYNNSEPESQGMFFIVLAGLLIQSTNDDPEAPKKVVNILQSAIENFDKAENNHSKIVGDVKYSASSNKVTGTWFNIDPK